ncbi:fumarylacetoacetate hydrolase family protein [Pseudohongiella spirulinae]|uniref:5-oxopent-3-ene-1,2,5-tricarboxylate decarboxylase n=1 Tax=Pseudohongiella spirulinae TaxID=1249552 RepID=A0A0S2KA16_9GAMM|nr:fumarylacetoacetate hydrolase family protein [Pseudohongiella spirulinae]ALO45096.1 5-oxopent-3-ene-1,2,5-tricarboxylate decarboxylase [Pseudohongiella spirulinae]
MKNLFELAQPVLPIVSTDQQFPINRVFCVGRNYAEHAKEMGADPSREAPFFFSKPACAVFVPSGEVPYPPRTQDLHHEGELVVALHKGGRNLTLEQAREAVYGYAVGVDFTRRDLQGEAKKQGRPWDVSKGFDASGPVSPLVPKTQSGWLEKGSITLSVNGQPRQQGDLSDMIWKVDEIIAELSTYYILTAGDLIFTGTPAGVSAVELGDEVLVQIAGVGELRFKMV